MTREEQQLMKRLEDLARAAFEKGIPLYSDFLNLNERSIFESVKPKLSFVISKSFGGYKQAERQMVAFLPDAPVFLRYPFVCVRIAPLQAKFSEDLSHRDYLGAILNTGMERSRLGDLLVEEGCAYVFVQEKLAEHLCRELTIVRHTSVQAQVTEDFPENYEPRFREVKGTVASVRLDSLLSLAFGGSRSSLTGLIEAGKVFVNGKLITSNGYTPREEDLISVRGMGRFQYVSQGGQSKKGRNYVTVKRYI
ncbi:MAG: RNA-binding protein [Lachnospiraceae bacterium]|nr:RNA-binding protein [Lachnospiraceae bacterium]